MPQLTFISPAALALLALVPLVWAFALLVPRRVARWRLWVGLALRTAMLVALVGALAGTQLVRPVRDVTTVFLLDASDSVAPAQQERATRYITDALRAMPSGGQAAVVVFGENALVERAPSVGVALGRIASVPIATRTNIQDAVQLGLALLPADTQQRLVLLSDGGENSGRATDAARLAAVRGVPLDVLALPSERGPDVVLSALDAPATAREGQEIALNAVVDASFATSGQLQVFVDGQLLGTQDVRLQPGTNSIPLRVPAGEAGFRRLEARLEAQGDATPQNNRAASFTDVQGPPRILVVASDAARAGNLRGALEAAGVRVDVRVPDQSPATLESLSDYAGVILVDTPARLVPRALLETLPAYVRDLGRGFAMIGGEESFGAGGYRRTPVEEALPVDLDPRDTSTTPDVALVLVIDRSGSMSEASAGGRTRLDLAKEAVYQASLALSPQDQVGLVVFDDQANWALNLQRLPSAVDIEQALSTFGPGGGTNIRPGVEQAAQALATTEARIKHVILLTDGEADANYGDVVDAMRDGGITISTVGIGSNANPNLEGIAQRGNGRFYRVAQASDVPKVFLQETVTVAGRDVVEETIVPQAALATPLIRSLQSIPALRGYNGTEPKDAARTILQTPDGKPILAQWQFGLGRAVAWTSDLQNNWAANWITWSEFPRFVGGLVDLLLPPQSTGQISVQSTTNGAQTALDVTAFDAQGRPLNDLAVRGRLTAPQTDVEETGRTLDFVQVGPGRYRATTITDAPGVYLAQIAASGDGQDFGNVTTGVVVSYSPEYGANRENLPLLNDLASATGGRAGPEATTIFAPTGQNIGSITEIALPLLWLALLLLPLDIAVRRLFVRRSDLAASLEARRQERLRPTREAEAVMARLGAAKRRAGQGSGVGGQGSEAVVQRTQTVHRTDTSTDERSPTPDPRPLTPDDDDPMARLRAAKRRARER